MILYYLTELFYQPLTAPEGEDFIMKTSRIRKLFSFLLAILYLVSVIPAVPVSASGSSDAYTSGGTVRIIRVGFFAFAGYHMQDADGRRSGYGYDFLQEMARYGNWTYEYTGYDKSWSQMQDMLASGEIDLLTSAQKTPEREEQFAFSNSPIGTNSAILTVKSGDTRYRSGSYDTYNGMRIGLLEGSSRNSRLDAFAADKGFVYTPVYYQTSADMEDDLQSGTNIDALFSSSLRIVENEWILDEFDPSDFYVMVRKDDTALLNDVNSAIAQMDHSDANWRSELWNKYYKADSGSEISFTEEEQDYIDKMKADGTPIRAIVEPDRAPYSYFENGEAKGIIPELFRKITSATGLAFDIVETKNRSDYFDTLQADNGINVRIDAYDDLYDAEETGYKLTSRYLTTSVSAVTQKSFTGTPASAAIAEEADPTDYREAIMTSGMSVQQYDTMAECLDAVRNGKADTAYVLTYSAQQYLSIRDINNKLETKLLPQYSVSYAIGVADSEDIRLLSILEKAVGNLKSSDTEAIILAETQSLQKPLSFREYLTAHPAVMILIFGSLIILTLLLLLLLYRQKSMRLIRAKNEELQNALLCADKANAAKSEFLSRVSHDMRTPLNGVVSYIDFAANTKKNDEKQKYLKKARKSAAILTSLINDTLQVSRIESGNMELKSEWVRFRELFDGVATVIESSAARKNITFAARSDFSKSEYIFTDKLRLQDLMLNLLSNAVNYTPHGGRIDFEVCRVDPCDDGRNIRIIVSDNGRGISKSFLPRIFEPFVQEHEPTSGVSAGSGLGLYIVKRVTDLMGGTIDVESDIGKITTFTVMLPLPVEDRKETPEEVKRTAYDFSGRKFLLCEDNFVNTEIARILLCERGAEVVCTENGKRGAEIFAGSKLDEFDAILMDIHMPQMDGYEATKVIRAMDREDAVTVPIIAMTADAYEEDIRHCLDAGMNGHTAKPIDPDKLFTELARVIR